MSFPIAVQSAIFYIVACTPCAKARHRQKARDQAKRERLDKDKLETEQPGMYRHPSPFTTNPYWQEEITMGPSLPKKAASKNSSQRGLTSSAGDSDVPSMSEHTNVEDSRTQLGVSLSTSPTGDKDLSDDWNRRRYQREDEELWGQWSGHKLMDAISKARGSAGRLIESTLGLEKEDKEVTEQERRQFYFSPRNPPVNDYHPPVVSSKAPHRDAHKWMLQPPPPAKVMEGKVPVNRTVSTGSKSSGRTLAVEEVQLGRLVQERLAKQRLKKETSSPTEDELIESLFVVRSNRSLSSPRSRSMSLDGSEESLDNLFEWRRRGSRLRSRAAPPGSESEDDEPGLHHSATLTVPPAHVVQRPKLETIRSSGSLGTSSRVSSKRSRRQRPIKMRPLSGAASPVGDDSD